MHELDTTNYSNQKTTRRSGKKKNRSHLPVGGPFTPLLNELHDSDAYKSITGNAAKLYGYILRVARTVAVKTGTGSELFVQFDYTYTEAKKRGFSESTFRRSLKELWSKGFISVISIGGRTTSEAYGRVPSRYQLSGAWKTYGHGGSKWTDRTRFEADPSSIPSEPRKQP